MKPAVRTTMPETREESADVSSDEARYVIASLVEQALASLSSRLGELWRRWLGPWCDDPADKPR